jgi:hypothetical protein
MALITLVDKFKSMFDEGYGEEDILDAFIATLEACRVQADENFSVRILQKRIKTLEIVKAKWSTHISENDLPR